MDSLATVATQDSLVEYFTNYVKEWRVNNGITYDGALETADLKLFAENLQSELLKKVKFDVPGGKTLVNYSDYPFAEIKEFCKGNNDFYCISQTEAGIVTSDDAFRNAVRNVVVDESAAERLLGGKGADKVRIDNIGVENTDILSIDDLVSKNVTRVAVQNGNEVVFILGDNVKSNSVAVQTEIPEYVNEAWIGKTPNNINGKLYTVNNVNQLSTLDYKIDGEFANKKIEFTLDSEKKLAELSSRTIKLLI